MSIVEENLYEIKRNLPLNVTLVAVSKRQPISSVKTAYEAGQRDFGENYIQEMLQKYEVLPKDIRWHMIGNAQRNKLKYIVPFVHLIHGIEKLNQLETLNKEAEKYQRVIRCLLQVKICQEENKYGMTDRKADEILTSEAYVHMNYVKIIGLMGIATFTRDNRQLCKEFESLYMLFKQLKEKNASFEILSMGMSTDYQKAIAFGSTMIRVGRAIFGARNY